MRPFSQDNFGRLTDRFWPVLSIRNTSALGRKRKSESSISNGFDVCFWPKADVGLLDYIRSANDPKRAFGASATQAADVVSWVIN